MVRIVENEFELFSPSERCRFEDCGNAPYKCIDTEQGRAPICKTHYDLITEGSLRYMVKPAEG